ncbi:hypothetical protein [Eleftheria terrae]|uniref:hypothetical protein n=1 Tax=Eleftheria terrae TaxID=1597781 RepID=UPI00263B2EDB|nr:hypothetical protein [Eleftheria terrae]WKB53033.1 hypothetical protein N7L95_01100 [Eleftheria terrae]
MILPAWLSPRVLGAAAVLAGLALSHGWAYRAGGRAVQDKWDAAVVEADRLANERRAEDQRLAARAAAAHQEAAAAIQAELAKTQEALDAALNEPVPSCPRSAGDAVVPAAVWLRLQAIDDAGPASTARAKPAR